MPDENRYDDIIGLPHHVSRAHPPMTRLNRAAQFAPFAALTGYGDAIAEAARLTEARIDLTEAEQAAISERLVRLRENLAARPRVTITYFRPDERKAGGRYLTMTGVVRRVRETEREIVMEDGTAVAFEDIMEIEGALFGA